MKRYISLVTILVVILVALPASVSLSGPEPGSGKPAKNDNVRALRNSAPLAVSEMVTPATEPPMLAPAASPPTYQFTLIAEIVGNLAVGPPAINNAGTVAFGMSDATGKTAIYTGQGGGSFAPVGIENTGNFSGFSLSSLDINDTGAIKFHATGTRNGQFVQEVYTGTGASALTLIYKEAPADGLHFVDPTGLNSFNNAGTVGMHILEVQPGSREGIFTGDGGPLVTIANAPTSPYNSFGFPAVNNAGVIVFKAQYNNYAGKPSITALFTSSGGAITDLGPIMNGLGPDSPVINDNGVVAFVGSKSEKIGGCGTVNCIFQITHGVYTIGPGGLSTIAQEITITPNSHSTTFGAVSMNNAGTVVFGAAINQVDGAGGQSGIFTGNLQPIRKVGDPLLGSTVRSIGLGGLNDSGQIAFTALLANGKLVVVRADPPRSPTPVIFVPGISGSVLVDGAPNGQELWLDPLDNIPPATNRIRLSLFPADNPSPGIEATDVMRSVHVGNSVVGFSVKQVYAPFLDYLKTVGGYREYQVNGFPFRRTESGCDLTQKHGDPDTDPNLFLFAYDWRKSNIENAVKLKDYVGCVKQFYPDSKINIVTHSMGSLIARRYILDNPADHKVDKLITMAAPWLGAPKLLHALETGEFIRIHGIGLAAGPDIKYIAPSLTAAHQLLPSPAYLALGGQPILVEEGWDYDGNGVDHETYDYNHLIGFLNTKYPGTMPGATADAFHSFTTANGAQDDWRSDTTGVKYFHFYGVQFGNETIERVVATTQLVCYGGLTGGCSSMNVLEPRYTVGDKTVPARSLGRRTGFGNYNAPNAQVFRITNSNPDLVEHTGITENPEVQSGVLSILNQASVALFTPPRLQPFAVQASRTVQPVASSAPRVDSLRRSAHVKGRRGIQQVVPGDDEQSTIPSDYLSIIGGASVVVRDTHGNSTAPLIGDLLGTVPGVETFFMGNNAEAIALPVSTTEEYSITFNSTDQPIAIKIVRGVDNVTPTDLIKYQDVTLPAGVAAQIKIGPQGVDDLHYDSDGDGTFETAVTPTVSVTGLAAQDVTPPNVLISAVMQTTTAVFTISAQDIGSGVKAIRYSLDGTHFQTYAGPFSLDRTQNRTIYAFADDNVANRSGVVTYTFKAQLKGAAEQVADLMALIDTFNLKKKVDKKFDHKLSEVLKSLNKGKTDEGCKKLVEFIKDAQKQSGKKLTAAEATQIIAAAKRIREVLRCK